MATVMNYKDEDIEMLEDDSSQNNGELLKERQDNDYNSSLQQQIYNNNGITTGSNNNHGNVSKEELLNSQPTGQSAQPPGRQTEKTNEISNGLKKSQAEKNSNNGCQYNVVNSNNLRNNGTGTSNGQHNNNPPISSQNQTIPLCEQEGQVKMMKLAGLTVLMHKKKGEIIYRLADNMSVSSLSDVQREALLKEIKTLHDSNAIVTQSVSQLTQNQGSSATSSQSTSNISRLHTSTSLPDHQSAISHDTSMRTRTSASQPIKSSSFPSSTLTSSITANKSVNSTAALDTQTSSKQLYIPLASRPPLVVTETHSSAVQSSDRSQPIIHSNTTSQTLYPSPSLEDSFCSDGSSRSTRRYTKTGRYAKKRSMDEADSQYTQEYSSQYQHIPANTTIPTNSHLSAQTSQMIQSTRLPQSIQTTYYTSTTPTTRPIVQYYSAPPTHGVKRSLQSTGIQRTAEEINHNLDILQRFEAATKADQMAVLQPDYKTPFRSFQDAVARLLPYHVFEYPDEDMRSNDQTSDLDATKNALRFYKRRKVIFDKYNDLLKKEAERTCSTAHTNLCERLIVEDEKTENMTLKEECRQLSEQIKSRSQLLLLQQRQLQLQLQSTSHPSKQSELPQRQN